MSFVNVSVICNCKPLLFVNIHCNQPVEDCSLAAESSQIINILNQRMSQSLKMFPVSCTSVQKSSKTAQACF